MGLCERETGIEPATFYLASRRSTTELLPQNFRHYTKILSLIQLISIDSVCFTCDIGTRRMLKKLALVFSWFTLTSLSVVLLFVLIYQKSQINYLSKVGPALVAESSPTENNVNGQVLGVAVNDIRPYLVSNFLKGTKLEQYSQLIVDTSDKYGIDYRLIPAIAMKEGGGGNAVPESGHNSWGFENGRTNWTSWEEAIDNVGKTLKERYVDRGLVTPEQIMAIYAPPAILNGGQWAKDINHFFSKMESL